MSTQLVQKAHHIEAILRCSRTSRGRGAEIAEWKDEMICAVESEARNAVASIRIVEFLRESTEVRAAVADLQSGNSFRIAVGAAQLLVRSTGVVTATTTTTYPSRRTSLAPEGLRQRQVMARGKPTSNPGNRTGGTRQCRRADEDQQVSSRAFWRCVWARRSASEDRRSGDDARGSRRRHWTRAAPPAARRELADIGNILEATIRFSGIENEGTRK